jgi:hypothetical protein
MNTIIETPKIRKISEEKNGIISGPFSPMYTAKAIAELLEMPLKAFYRIYFESEKTLNEWDPKPYKTGYDHLIILCKAGETYCAAMVINEGVQYIPIAMMFDTDTEPTYTDVYKPEKYINAPGEEVIQEMLETTLLNAPM